MVVEFTKKDNTHRVMECTRNFAYVPKDKLPKSNTAPNDPPDLIRVFDLDKQEWRSFRYSTVTSFLPSHTSTDYDGQEESSY